MLRDIEEEEEALTATIIIDYCPNLPQSDTVDIHIKFILGFPSHRKNTFRKPPDQTIPHMPNKKKDDSNKDDSKENKARDIEILHSISCTFFNITQIPKSSSNILEH